ncbi:MAG: hypothetical protein AAFW81_00200 [Pseudomonadota bacterium]
MIARDGAAMRDTSKGLIMDEGPSTLSAFEAAVTGAMTAVFAYAPFLAGAAAILLAGWIVATLVRATARRTLGGVNRLFEGVFRRGALSRARLSKTAIAVLSEVLFWGVILLSAAIAARVAKLPAVSGWLNDLAGWLPNLLIGLVIIIAGYLVSVVAGEQAAATARLAKSGQSALVGRLVQSAIFITALIIGLDQLGVNVTFLVALFAVAAGAIFIGFSLAFGLGARDYVSNLIGARTAQRRIKPGARVRIGDYDGDVLEITPTQIALDTAEGRVLLPARLAEEHPVLFVTKDAKGPASQ